MLIGLNNAITGLTQDQLSKTINSLFSKNEQGIWYDPSDYSTMFEDAAGTIPITSPLEKPVGLMLDKSKGLALGSELVLYPLAATLGSSYTIVGDTVVRSGSTGTAVLGAVGAVAPVATKTYLVTFTASNVTGDSTGIRVGGGTAYGPFAGNGTFTLRVAGGGTGGTCITFLPWSGGAATATYSNISVRELPGNHAYQSTSTSRPTLSARYNLLTKTEQFDDAAWGKQSISAVTTTALNGTQTAFKLVPAAEAHTHVVFQAGITPLANCVVRFYAKAAGYSTLTVYEFPNASSGASFNLATGSVTNVNSGVGTITPAGDGWYLCTVTVSLTGVLFYIPSASSVFVGDEASGVTIWRPSIVASNDGVNLPSYQRVDTATSYDYAGFPPYLRFDGTDDGLVTNSIDFSATDKMFVAAGVRKLSDAAQGMLFETSANATTNAGTFFIDAPNSVAANYAFLMNGSGGLEYYVPTTYSAPITNVISCAYNIGTTAPNKIIPRINGVVNQTGAGATATATGNYGAYPLYIGRRGGSTLPFNGRLYGLTIVGKAASATEISSTEAYLNNKTKAY